jgi:hypothetical protein
VRLPFRRGPSTQLAWAPRLADAPPLDPAYARETADELTKILFRTIHGSHLYGLARPDSDIDYYEVVDSVPTKRAGYCRQTISDGIDVTRIDLGTWIRQCERGTPQALEAMFSRTHEIDHIGPLRAGFRAGGPVMATYLRTIRSFIEATDPKRTKHAVRLALNAQSIARYGRFDPRLTGQEAGYVWFLSEEYSGEHLLERCEQLVWL